MKSIILLITLFASLSDGQLSNIGQCQMRTTFHCDGEENSGGFPSTANIRGLPGKRGQKGESGADGERGTTGISGPQGMKGQLKVVLVLVSSKVLMINLKVLFYRNTINNKAEFSEIFRTKVFRITKQKFN